MTTEKEEKEKVVIIKVHSHSPLFKVGVINEKFRHFDKYGQGNTPEEALDNFKENILVWWEKTPKDYSIFDETDKTITLGEDNNIIEIKDS